jgi:hypothetical protein
MVRLSKQNPKYSFIKMPNPSYTLNIVQKIGSIKIDDYVHLMIIKNEVFSLMKEIKHLDLEALETASYKIKSNSSQRFWAIDCCEGIYNKTNLNLK